MNITIAQKSLAAGISSVIRAVATSTTVPALNGILIEAGAGTSTLTLRASDAMITIEKRVALTGDVAEGAAGGIVLPAKFFSDVVKKVPAGNVDIEVDEHNWTAKIAWSKGHCVLHGQAPSEFPKVDLGDGVSKEQWAPMTQAVLATLIDSTVFAASDNESRPVLTGALVEFREEGIRMVCIDGVRLAMRSVAMKMAISNLRKAVIPAKSLKELSRLLDAGNCWLAIGESYAYCNISDHARFSTRLLEGQFPPYEHIIPSKFQYGIEVDAPALKDACTRAALLSGGDDHAIRLQCSDDGLLVTSSTPEVGKVREQLDCRLDGGPLEVGFNARFLTDGLEKVASTAVLQANGAYSPMVLKSKNSDEFVYVAMPLRTMGE